MLWHRAAARCHGAGECRVWLWAADGWWLACMWGWGWAASVNAATHRDTGCGRHTRVCARARVVVGAIAHPVGPPAAAHVRARPHTQPCERRLNCALAAHTQWRWTHPERASTSHPPHARWHTTHAHTAGGMHVLSCIHTAPRPPAHIRLICRRVPRGMCNAALTWVLRPGGKQGVYIVCYARH